MKRFLGIILVALMVFATVGCAGKTQDTTLKAYASTGVLLKNVQETSAALCDAKYIPGKTCNQMVDIYGKAKASYIVLGDTAIIVAKSADTLQKQVEACEAAGIKKCDLTNVNFAYQSALQLYQKQFADAQKLFNELVKLSAQFKGGSK